MKTKRVRVCDLCPCQGEEGLGPEDTCNLGYAQRYVQVRERDWRTISENCKLVKITTASENAWNPTPKFIDIQVEE